MHFTASCINNQPWTDDGGIVYGREIAPAHIHPQREENPQETRKSFNGYKKKIY